VTISTRQLSTGTRSSIARAPRAVHDPDLDGAAAVVWCSRAHGKLDGVAIRVPTPNVSVVDFKFIASADHQGRGQRRAPARRLAAAQGHSRFHRPANVSIDFNHDPRSSVFHMDQTKVMDARWCASCRGRTTNGVSPTRMADTAVAMGKLI